MGHLTALGARTLAWPQRPHLAEQDPRNPCSENRAHPAVVRPAARRWKRATLAATREEHPFSAGRRRRMQSAVVEHGIKPGSRNEAVAVPNTVAHICGREVTVSCFVGGATLVEAFHAACADFREGIKTKEARHARALQQSVSHGEWRLDGCDIVGRADPARRPRPLCLGG